MFKRKLAKVIVSLLRRIANVSRAGAKRLMRAMLRSLMAMGRRAKLPVAGFVLPTVTMVMLVVVLLTLAITLRSFDRAQNARNVRVNQQVLAAATPALDRAKAKIQFLLSPQGSRTTGTPSDQTLNTALSTPSSGSDIYTFQDETRLRVQYDLKRNTLTGWNTDPNLLENENFINTAWRFPADTDNNGLFDSYTIYGIYFRSPPRGGTAGDFLSERKPLEARTPPMPGQVGNQCAAAGSSASLIGDSGWYKAQGRLKKSFFVYTAIVPITDTATSSQSGFEKYKGTKGFSSLEYQQDYVRIPLLNNAAVYEDDLEISPGTPFRLNGAMLTNSNLLVTSTNNQNVDFYLVSGTNSCYYQVENSKIRVGGNVVNGWSGGTDNNSVPVRVDLFKTGSPDTSKTIQGATSVTNNSLAVMYNNKAYSDRISALVNSQMTADPTGNNDPLDVKTTVAQGTPRAEALTAYFKNITRKVPFQEAAFNSPAPPTGTNYTTGTQNALRSDPSTGWMLPTNGTAAVGQTTGPTGLTIKPDQLPASKPPSNGELLSQETQIGDRVLAGNNLPLSWWDDTKNNFVTGSQQVDGTTGWTDDASTPRTRTTQKQNLADVSAVGRDLYWEQVSAQRPKTPLSSTGGLRVITGAGVYERKNSFLPPPAQDDSSTAAVNESTYDDPATTAVEQYPIVWPDTMPMSPGPNSKVYNNAVPASSSSWVDLSSTDWATLSLNASAAPANLTPATSTIDPNTRKYAKGDLRMRATAVYHYAQSAYDPNATTIDFTQAPIACVSSYYDPSYRYTAPDPANPATTITYNSGRNIPLAGNPYNNDANGKSNNGIVYPPPALTDRPTAATLPDATTGLFPGLGENATATLDRLYYQANLVFPDGRFANGPLREALTKLANAQQLTLANQSAIDSTLCALNILQNPTSFTTTPTAGVTINHGAIEEVSFLNPREVKALDADSAATTVDETFTLSSPLATAQSAKLTGNYDLSIEERMPLETRVTKLNLDALRNQTIPFQAPITGPSPEYLLPNSGIIYASREDALPDRSDRTADATNTTTIPYGINAVQTKSGSSTDSLLDPTRRPNGIMLTGRYLARNDQNNDGQNDTAPTNVADVLKEKGLTLVADVPVYVQPSANNEFNPHSQEEFNTALTSDWSNFYTRTGINANFACRPGDPRLPSCTAGDTWRSATVLSDSVTLLSQNFTPGFRNQGDFDLRNNAGGTFGSRNIGYDLVAPFGQILPSATVTEPTYGLDLNGNGVIDPASVNVKETEVTAKAARLLNGFFTNNYVTNGLSSGGFTFNANDIRTGVPSTTVTPTDSYYSASSPNPAQVNSSYFNNFVTPVQRRGDFPEYVMEMCRKLPVSACGPSDWKVGYDYNDDGDVSDSEVDLGVDLNGSGGAPEANVFERDVEASQLIGTAAPSLLLLAAGEIPTTAAAPNLPGLAAPYNLFSTADPTRIRLGAGTNAQPPLEAGDKRYPRRVSFLRSWSSSTAPSTSQYTVVRSYGFDPLPIGINENGSGNANDVIAAFSPYNYGSNAPKPRANALWFATNQSGLNYGRTGNLLMYRYLSTATFNTTFPSFGGSPVNGTLRGEQPLLMPVLQIQAPTATTQATQNSFPFPADVSTLKTSTRWLPQALNTTFNLVIGGGDTPARALNGGTIGDYNGGLQNLPRFVENWLNLDTKILGSFIQLNRSSYATAPYQSVLGDPPTVVATPVGTFGYYPQIYATDNNRATAASGGRSPSFSPPQRLWGYDVGLLSQTPDLFTQNFTTPPTRVSPDEFFREVGRNDIWIKTLLCSVEDANTTKTAVSASERPTDCLAKTGF